MITTLYLIRHGTTDNNIDGRFQGSLDAPLNAQGLAQAKCLGERFSDIPIDQIYTSPLIRAVQTADGLRGDKPIALLSMKGLMEIDGGAMEGLTVAENDEKFPGLMDTFRTNPPAFSAPGGETTRQVYDRMVKTIQTIVARHPGKTIACVSHGFAIQTFLCWAHKTPFDAMAQHILNNTGVCQFTFDDAGRCTIGFIGDDSHLPEELKCTQPRGFGPEGDQ
ncbi:MAG: histidine phosphatase family protein [Eubacterium sp.]|nr:histidine phosphatase family protein [Eubacterium sp.]